MRCTACIRNTGLKKLVPVIAEMDDVLIYHSCKANTYTAIKRDCLEVLTPDVKELNQFYKYYDTIFETEIVPLIANFEYDFNAWYNHLDSKQQKHIDKVDLAKLHKRQYCMFCKLEKQAITDKSKNPKNRCICGPNEEYKFVMGSVVHRLEAIFKKNFKGYCSGRSWKTRETIMNLRRKYLNLVVQGDGSGFDRTQYNELKYMERKIYNYLNDSGLIHHVPYDAFAAQANMDTVEIIAKVMTKVGNSFHTEKLGSVFKTGGRQTGDIDTSFGNTLHMVMYIRYICEVKLGLDKDSYDLDAAGDDFAAYLPPHLRQEDIERAFLTVFSRSKTGVHGLGQILKFLRFSDIDGTDFCSTETYWSEQQKSYKIIRKLDRFFTLSAWSRKALHMSAAEQRNYMMDLYQSNKEWMEGLPILTEYNELIRVFAEKLEVGKNKIKSKTPKGKKILPVPNHIEQLYHDSKSQRFDNLLHKFGRDDAYAMMDRVSPKKGTEDDFLKYIKEKYLITQGEIESIIRDLNLMREGRLSYDYSIPLLRKMCDQKVEGDEQQQVVSNLLTFNTYKVRELASSGSDCISLSNMATTDQLENVIPHKSVEWWSKVLRCNNRSEIRSLLNDDSKVEIISQLVGV